ncbi:hypothetical protein [Brumimicrobium oceani]|uniref:Uncharacterized protein n=1 Tax=Brumimicrobium oceani TaxID=2100725 RepID=A0A2U2X2D2_9FLAO|nr:hypothetical protein [Brumimicrobium oceani]PWH81909.1 hypothetical protein DIT68_14550 [Brumimicrobium oceani]
MKDQIISDYIKMISKYSSLIISEANNSWKGIDFSKTEPQIIKDYLLSAGKGVDYLNHKISSVIHTQTRYEVKFASVYCHQKPRIVRTNNSITKCLGSTPSCELGDLMTIFVLLDKNKKIVHSTAKITQAKKKDILDSESQKCLYESDLDFEMPQNIVNESTNPDKLRILPNFNSNRNNALSYLILNNGFPLNKEIPNSSNLSYSWSHHLNLMMEFKTGLSFVAPTNKADNGWNCIINDLINIGAVKIKSSTKRGSGLEHFINAFNYYYTLHDKNITN